MEHARGEEDFTFTARTEESERRQSELWEKYQGIAAELEALQRKAWLLADDPRRETERLAAEARLKKLKRESVALAEELESLN